MFKTIDRMLLASLGMLSMTRKTAEAIFEDLVREGQMQRDRREGFVQEMMDSADRTRAELEEVIARQVRSAVDRLELATRADVARLESKLNELLRTCSNPCPPSAPPTELI